MARTVALAADRAPAMPADKVAALIPPPPARTAMIFIKIVQGKPRPPNSWMQCTHARETRFLFNCLKRNAAASGVVTKGIGGKGRHQTPVDEQKCNQPQQRVKLPRRAQSLPTLIIPLRQQVIDHRRLLQL